MKRSGNHTTAKQYIYVLVNFPYFWVIKVGIGGNKEKRIRSIDKEAPGKDFCLMSARLHFAYGLEQSIHLMLAPLNYRADPKKWGSGHTERFWFPALLLAIPVILFAWVLQLAVYFFVIGSLFWLALKFMQ